MGEVVWSFIRTVILTVDLVGVGANYMCMYMPVLYSFTPISFEAYTAYASGSCNTVKKGGLELP
jgi:hypothetical protein